MWPDSSQKNVAFTPVRVLIRVTGWVSLSWLAGTLDARSFWWDRVLCAFCLPRIRSLLLWFAHWHFQMWVVHKGCDWGERLTFCLSVSAWQWLRSIDICESAKRSAAKIFYYEKERKITHYTLAYICTVICARRKSDKCETEKDKWRGKKKEKEYRKMQQKQERELNKEQMIE